MNDNDNKRERKSLLSFIDIQSIYSIKHLKMRP